MRRRTVHEPGDDGGLAVPGGDTVIADLEAHGPSTADTIGQRLHCTTIESTCALVELREGGRVIFGLERQEGSLRLVYALPGLVTAAS